MSQLQKQRQHLVQNRLQNQVQNLVLIQILLVFLQKSQLESGWVLYIVEKLYNGLIQVLMENMLLKVM